VRGLPPPCLAFRGVRRLVGGVGAELAPALGGLLRTQGQAQALGWLHGGVFEALADVRHHQPAGAALLRLFGGGTLDGSEAHRVALDARGPQERPCAALRLGGAGGVRGGAHRTAGRFPRGRGH